MQHYVIKFVSDLRQVCGFLREVFIILKDVTMTWQKWGPKQALEKRKTSLSLMEVFNIALKDKNIGWCLTFVGVYIQNVYNTDKYPGLYLLSLKN
jgi:hypothetical protein